MARKQQNGEQADSSPAGMTLAVFGADGNLGKQILIACEGEGIAIDRLIPVTSKTAVASEIAYQARSWKTVPTADVDVASLDAAIIATPQDGGHALVESLRSKGIFTIDLTSVSHEVFPVQWPASSMTEEIEDEGGVCIPGAISSTVAPVLKRFASLGKIASIHIVVLLSAALQGKKGPETLSEQTLNLLNFRIPEVASMGGLLAFNLLPGNVPHSGDAQARSRNELLKLMPELPAEGIYVQCIRVPVFSGLGCSIQVQFDDDINKETLEEERSTSTELLMGGPLSGLRDTVESDSVLLCSLDRPDTKSISCICFADPTHRTSMAVSKVLHAFAQDNL
jgi:aspartate-semialdehyde dehydrogenase